ncbi:MAG: hypothetical protein ACI4MI_04745 [Christensenellales bacterium]
MAKNSRNNYSDPLYIKGTQSVFNLYRNRKEIGDEMIKSFIGYDLNKNSKGFLIEEGEKEVGVIGQCYGLLTIMEYAKFRINVTKYSDAVKKINQTLNDIFNRVVADDGTLVFDASPHVFSPVITKYVETAALFLRVLVEIRGLLYDDLKKSANTIEIDSKFIQCSESESNDERTKKEIEFVESLLVKTMDFINDSALIANGDDGLDYYLSGSDIEIRDDFGMNIKYKGWTFTSIPKERHAKTEISLYHTFVVGETYLAFFEFFTKPIAIVRQLRDAIFDRYRAEGKVTENGYVNVPMDEIIDKIVNVDEKEFGIKIDNEDAYLQRDFKFLRSIYRSFNQFVKTMYDAGHYVDMQFRKIDTTKDFFNYNFKKVTADDIESSSSSDAMFNVLMAINIIMASGVDVDYANNGLTDDYYDKLQYSVPNVQRFYKQLIRAGKGDMYDQYVLKINTAIPNDDQDDEKSPFNQARLLRKQHVVLLNLLPIIIKTYCTVSKYTIQYPQYEMRSYKDEIMKKKMDDQWLWEKEEYNLINNYNHVFALRSFYDYYEIYERPYSLEKYSYIEESKTVIDKLNEKLKGCKTEINNLKEEYKKVLSQHEDEKKSLCDRHDLAMQAEKIRYDEKKAPIELDIEALMKKSMGEYVRVVFKDILNEFIEQNGRMVNDKEDLKTTFKRAMTSYLGEAFSITTELFDQTDESKEQYEQMGQELVDEAINILVNEQLIKNKGSIQKGNN